MTKIIIQNYSNQSRPRSRPHYLYSPKNMNIIDNKNSPVDILDNIFYGIEPRVIDDYISLGGKCDAKCDATDNKTGIPYCPKEYIYQRIELCTEALVGEGPLAIESESDTIFIRSISTVLLQDPVGKYRKKVSVDDVEEFLKNESVSDYILGESGHQVSESVPVLLNMLIDRMFLKQCSGIFGRVLCGIHLKELCFWVKCY